MKIIIAYLYGPTGFGHNGDDIIFLIVFCDAITLVWIHLLVDWNCSTTYSSFLLWIFYIDKLLTSC